MAVRDRCFVVKPLPKFSKSRFTEYHSDSSWAVKKGLFTEFRYEDLSEIRVYGWRPSTALVIEIVGSAWPARPEGSGGPDPAGLPNCLMTTKTAVYDGQGPVLLDELRRRVVYATDASHAIGMAEHPLETYEVIYLGGHPAYPRKTFSSIRLSVYLDRFELRPGSGSTWFAGLTIPYVAVHDFEIAERLVTTPEALLGGLNSRQLNVANNVHITYTGETGTLRLRLEMLSGFTVMGQARKCRELEDMLRIHRIQEQFRNAASVLGADTREPDDIPAQIEKLAGLRDKGIITAEEFEAKKTDLLSRM